MSVFFEMGNGFCHPPLPAGSRVCIHTGSGTDAGIYGKRSIYAGAHAQIQRDRSVLSHADMEQKKHGGISPAAYLSETLLNSDQYARINRYAGDFSPAYHSFKTTFF